MKLFWMRLRTACKILFIHNRHWFLVCLTDDELKKHLTGKLENVTVINHKLHPYNTNTIIQCISNGIDKDELILQKAAFEGEVEYRSLLAQKH